MSTPGSPFGGNEQYGAPGTGPTGQQPGYPAQPGYPSQPGYPGAPGQEPPAAARKRGPARMIAAIVIGIIAAGVTILAVTKATSSDTNYCASFQRGFESSSGADDSLQVSKGGSAIPEMPPPPTDKRLGTCTFSATVSGARVEGVAILYSSNKPLQGYEAVARIAGYNTLPGNSGKGLTMLVDKTNQYLIELVDADGVTGIIQLHAPN